MNKNEIAGKLVKIACIYNDVLRMHNQAKVTIVELTNDEAIKEIILETTQRSSSMIDEAIQLMDEVTKGLMADDQSTTNTKSH